MYILVYNNYSLSPSSQIDICAQFLEKLRPTPLMHQLRGIEQE